ncbi:hypothetical protein GCM10020000_37800 [Streptomyces olivoverticillatus]
MATRGVQKRPTLSWRTVAGGGSERNGLTTVSKQPCNALTCEVRLQWRKPRLYSHMQGCPEDHPRRAAAGAARGRITLVAADRPP